MTVSTIRWIAGAEAGLGVYLFALWTWRSWGQMSSNALAVAICAILAVINYGTWNAAANGFPYSPAAYMMAVALAGFDIVILTKFWQRWRTRP